MILTTKIIKNVLLITLIRLFFVLLPKKNKSSVLICLNKKKGPHRKLYAVPYKNKLTKIL